MLKELFNQADNYDDQQLLEEQHLNNLPEGIENVDVSDIQKMINNSGESPIESHPSPGLELYREFNYLENADHQEIDFYDKMQKMNDEDGEEDSGEIETDIKGGSNM